MPPPTPPPMAAALVPPLLLLLPVPLEALEDPVGEEEPDPVAVPVVAPVCVASTDCVDAKLPVAEDCGAEELELAATGSDRLK